MKRLALIVGLALVTVILVACAEESERPETAAVVNGEAISMEKLDAQLEQVRAQYAMYGIDLDADQEMLHEVQMQILNELINQTLLSQYAAGQDITANQQEIDAYYAQIVEQFQGEEALEEAMEAQGMTRDQLIDMIADEIIWQKLIDHEREARDIVITEEDAREAYERYEEMGEEMPPFDEVRSFLEEELEYQQIEQDLIEELRQDGEIDIQL